MKSLYQKVLLVLVISIGIISCSPEDPIESTITYYPTIELLGAPIIPVEVNTTFDDPGISATIDGEEVPYETSNLDTSTPGLYTVVYTVTNEDGFSSSITRSVPVYENNGSIAGYWNGSSGNGSGFPILITTTDDPNTFKITDVLAGHYEYGVNYGPAYAVPSTLNYDGTSLSSPGGVNAFGTWTVDGPSISTDEKTMNWGATLIEQSFSLTGLQFDKVTP